MRLRQLQEANFQIIAHCYGDNGSRPTESYLFALSADQHTMVVIRYGGWFSVPACGTWLISKNSGGRHFFTIDSPFLMEYDVSGNSETKVVATMNFTNLYENHEQWVRTRALPYLFHPTNPVQEYRAYLLHRCLMRRILGLAYYADKKRTLWRYTFRGALRHAFGGMVSAVFRP